MHAPSTAVAEIVETTPKELVLRKVDPDEEGHGIIEAMPADAEDITVFARSPGEMAVAQDALIDWGQRKVSYLKKELRLAEDNLAAAAEAKVKTAPWKRLVGIAKRRVVYYEKIVAALEEGYFIVPDFPINVIAVRTKKTKPSDAGVLHTYQRGIVAEKPQELPVGEGEYVNPDPQHYVEDEEVTHTDHKGEKTKRMEKRYVACDEFDEIDFPLRVVRPMVLNQYQKTIQKKLFDSIGVLPNNRRNTDPMVVGTIEMRLNRHQVKRVNFLVCWWIPTQSL
jgi:hypothetical protein